MGMPKRASTGLWLGAVCVVLTTAAAAQTAQNAAAETVQPTGPENRFPCEQHEEFREFDFWVGAWDVRTAEGKFAGKNVIESSHRGCVLIENWVGTGGSTGTSMNYLDKTTGEWVQLWTDAGGSQITIRGGLTDAGMLLEGQIHYTATGITAPFRGLWTPQPDGRVRQFFEQSNDGGKTWEPWFEGYYSRTDTARESEGDKGG